MSMFRNFLLTLSVLAIFYSGGVMSSPTLSQAEVNASKYIEYEMWEEAIDIYDNILEYDSTNIPAYINRIKAKKGLNDDFGANDDYNDVMLIIDELQSREPENYISYVFLGQVYDSMGDYQKAIENIRKARKMNPKTRLMGYLDSLKRKKKAAKVKKKKELIKYYGE